MAIQPNGLDDGAKQIVDLVKDAVLEILDAEAEREAIVALIRAQHKPQARELSRRFTPRQPGQW